MRIVYLTNAIIPSRTANSIHVMKMCAAMAENGHEVRLIAPDRKDAYEEGVDDVYDFYGTRNTFSIKKLPYPPVKGKSLYFALCSAVLAKRFQPDLVYGRFFWGCCFALLLRAKVTLELHAPIWEYSKFENFFFILVCRSRKLNRIVLISDALKRMYLATRSYAIGEEKYFVAHDAAEECPAGARVRDWPGRHAALQVGYFGHLYEGRGIELLLALAVRLPEVDFHIVGGNRTQVGQWRQHGVPANVHFHGFVPVRAVHEYRGSCDVLVAPYQRDVRVSGKQGDTSRFMSPLKVFEYMASKKPMVVSDIPVLREVLDDQNSMLVPCDDTDAWCAALEVLKDPAIRERIARNAYTGFQRNYTWRKRAGDVVG